MIGGTEDSAVDGPQPNGGVVSGTPRRFRSGSRYSAVPDSLRGLYERYCDREAMELLSLMPRDALRPFYRRAAEWAEQGMENENPDPLAVVRGYARHLLPLPPYDAWIPLYLANRTTFLQSMEIPSAPRRDDPVAVAVRAFGDGWHAALCVTDAESGWNGFLQFHRSEGIQSCRTTDLFRGEEADEIRARFDSYDDATLVAFLRSALP